MGKSFQRTSMYKKIYKTAISYFLAHDSGLFVRLFWDPRLLKSSLRLHRQFSLNESRISKTCLSPSHWQVLLARSSLDLLCWMVIQSLSMWLRIFSVRRVSHAPRFLHGKWSVPA
jgi:hypothetical protein